MFPFQLMIAPEKEGRLAKQCSFVERQQCRGDVFGKFYNVGGFQFYSVQSNRMSKSNA